MKNSFYITISSLLIITLGYGQAETISDNAQNLSILKLKNTTWVCNQTTALEFWNGGLKNYPTSRIVSKMDGCGTHGEALIFETETAGDSAPSPKMTIKNNGAIGIGITNPQDILHVRGDNATLRLSSSAYHGGAGGAINTVLSRIKFSNRDDNHTYRSEIRGLLTGNWAEHIGLAFTTNSSGQQVERMRINHDGNVGIGTTSPDEKLTVKGTVHTQEVRVDLNVPAPDYVFEKDYNLRSLEDTETYINKNKHLPEIPSAKEMEANGVELGEMNMLLLKKIEELTLYTIEQDKALKQQQKLIETQRTEQSSQQQQLIEKLIKRIETLENK